MSSFHQVTFLASSIHFYQQVTCGAVWSLSPRGVQAGLILPPRGIRGYHSCRGATTIRGRDQGAAGHPPQDSPTTGRETVQSVRRTEVEKPCFSREGSSVKPCGASRVFLYCFGGGCKFPHTAVDPPWLVRNRSAVNAQPH